MPATREQLLARWETADGQLLAEQVRQALDPEGLRRRSPGSGGARMLDPLIVQRLMLLPFADEVTPQVDLRGLHVQDKTLSLKYIDLANVRLDYAYEIDRIMHCQVIGAILDGSRSINGRFTREVLSNISLVGASFNGGTFQRANLSGANLQGARLVLADFSNANCTGANFVGADVRFADVHGADFSGADLREADLTEANLGDVLFDAQTRLQGVNLRGAYLSQAFRTFAQQSGAQLSGSQTFSAQRVVELTATIGILQEQNVDGHLNDAIALISGVRGQLVRNPQAQFNDTLEAALAQAGSFPWVDEMLETWNDTRNALAYYL